MQVKSIGFQEIGCYELISCDGKGSNRVRISIKKEFKDALTNLGKFSHCVIFTRNENGISCYVVKIIEINEKSGEMIVEADETVREVGGFSGDLADIKPYFPCEEIAEGYESTGIRRRGSFEPIAFRGKPVGEYLFVSNCGMIQIRESEYLSAKEISDTLEKIHLGDFARVLWWFHRFDDKRYRTLTMCNPPYENAPRSGIFSTRSPVRPNPLASTIVKIKSVDKYNQSISVLGFDGFEHSVVLQIMPYADHSFDDIRVPKWVGHWTNYKVFHNSSEFNTAFDATSRILEASNEMKSFPYDSEWVKPDAVDNEAAGDEAVFCDELENDEAFESDSADANEIVVENASIHNLKDISVRIPKGKITVITGVSGSGKSSLAFDTIYHESQRQFIDLVSSNSPLGSELKESMVKKITGLQPSIAIEQKSLGANPRSTVASVTRIGEYLRLLFATIGERVCPNCNCVVPKNNVCDNCGSIFFGLTPAVFNYNHPEYMCPVCKGLGEELQVDIDLIVSNPELSILDGASDFWGNLRKHRERPNANWMKGEVLALAAEVNEDLEVPFKDLSEAFKHQIFYGSNGREVTLTYENPNGRNGTIRRPVEGVVNTIQRLLAENSANRSTEYIDRFIVNKRCSRCNGERLLEEGRMARISNTRYPETTKMDITVLKKWCHSTYSAMDNNQREKCRAIFTKIIARLKKLEQVGLGYITLDRSIPTLSGGEAQRLKIATQFGTGLSNIMYVMDEPSKGLHPKDYLFLIQTVRDLKKRNNTIIIVEHKREFINMADYLIEIGPGAGHYGGRLLRAKAVETPVMEQTVGIEVLEQVVKTEQASGMADEVIVMTGARTNNLKNIDISIPLSRFICVIGVSGSGKSSLISKTLYPAVMKELGKKVEEIGEYAGITGANGVNDIRNVSQKAIGRNSRSTPGTYTGVFDLIRDFYAGLSTTQKVKLTKEHFSFNSAKGQCEECKGAGEIAIPMHFMPDIYTVCSKCNGKRYQEQVLEVRYKGYSIADLLELEIGEVRELFKSEPGIHEILDMLCKVGLSYVKLGQNAATLSGGEAQRIKLAKELCDSRTIGIIYILDEPTTGLHDEDVRKLGLIISELTSKGATVIAIEHNPLLIKQADYVIEMGPEGGDRGGYVLREGWLNKR